MLPKLTYANVVATLALFIAIGGASAFAASQLGKNTVGSKQIKKNAVTGAKVKNDSLTGSDIDEATLGAVLNAQTVGGMSAAQIADTSKLRCPSGMELAVGVCFESTTRSPDDLLHDSGNCGNAGRRLPSQGELIAYEKQKFTEPPTLEWVGPVYYTGAETLGLLVSAYKSDPGVNFSHDDYTENHPYRCVTLASN
jgi:hypothetical protein